MFSQTKKRTEKNENRVIYNTSPKITDFVNNVSWTHALTVKNSC